MKNPEKRQSVPSLTTEEAANFFNIPPSQLRNEAKEQGGWCYKGNWVLKKNPEKRNSWYPYKSTMPRFKAI